MENVCIVRFFFPGVLVGPYLDFAEYRALVDESVFAAHAGNGRTKSGRAIPAGRKRVAYGKMVLGLGFLGLFVVFGGSCHFGIALTPWFVSKGWAYRCVVVLFSPCIRILIVRGRIAFHQVAGVVERCKYYAVWTLTEVSS